MKLIYARTLRIAFAFMLCLFTRLSVSAQIVGSFTVQGDEDKFYPVTFRDAAWFYNVATELKIGRSNVHLNGDWHGSLISEFKFHVSNWGNGAAFIDGFARQHVPYTGTRLMIAGWEDISLDNGSYRIAIWLRGNTTYYFQANADPEPLVYDGVQNALPVVVPNNSAIGPLTYRTQPPADVNKDGMTNAGNAYFLGLGTNYLKGNVGIGTLTTGTHKLAVDGSIGARKIKVSQETWADHVFDTAYVLTNLQDVEQYIKHNRHLPDIPAAAEVKVDGIDLGEMNKKLLQKIEELTLHMIDMNKRVQQLEEENKRLKFK
ncbi:hypothetical protein MKQ70_10950 [Chitinophaga sedimenti]|uniref:hypothetical protein n=1 Tax=Chitinophaga sedimenti TaxID=2033606 RepID=UPI002003695F|nr:hypothetical protein [Chitinophaga sedimenti]MCK7555497.1 hypothetical protein [Chitinophaga sedimenti]